MKTYKLLVDSIVVDDILDRLQQSQVIKHVDRQEIMAVPKNADRMSTLLDKILNSKLPYAFKALCDSIKFKYKSTHDTVMEIRKVIYKTGVGNTIGKGQGHIQDGCRQYCR
jgi:hypothetical protein